MRGYEMLSQSTLTFEFNLAMRALDETFFAAISHMANKITFIFKFSRTVIATIPAIFKIISIFKFIAGVKIKTLLKMFKSIRKIT